jgi:hypothetical protein
VPARILPVANQAPLKTEGLPRRLGCIRLNVSATYCQIGCFLASNIAILLDNIAILIGRLLSAIYKQREQIQIFCEFELAICSRRFQIAQRRSNQPIRIAILWDNIPMSLQREHPV